MGTLRENAMQRLAEPFDLLVIGGGINGLGIAWDAAVRGLSVLVIDKGDWGSGTSSWSSRMIHGGLKYLEKLEVGLVRESLRDREWLLRHAPHLVKPLPFVMPFYRSNVHHWALLMAGMVAYDVLSFDKSVPLHRPFTRKRTLERLPGVSRDGLQGSARYFDAQVEFAERLCVELMLAARSAGATTLNHAESVGLEVEGGRVVGASVRDGLTGEVHLVRASVTVNVAGPWADSVIAGTDAAESRLIGGTKGTHLIVDPFDGAPDEAIYYEAVTDGRPLMVIPWLGRYLIGSTDKRFSGDLDTAGADQEELDYILRETNRLFPGAGLTERSILYSYTGVRPLPYVVGGREGDVTRKHIVKVHDLGGLISIVGGKLTTFRTLAEHAVDAVGKQLGRRTRCHTRGMDLPGKPNVPEAQFLQNFIHSSSLDPATAERLVRTYGARAEMIGELALSDEALGRVIDPASGLLAAEVVFAVVEEEAVTLADVLARRTMVGLGADLGKGAMDAVAAVMAIELHWDAAEIARQKHAYLHYLNRFLEVEREAA